jgi:hypothetical protein
MKKKILIMLTMSVVIIALLAISTGSLVAAKSPQSGCTTIQDGTLLAKDGSVITTGYDDWGYNYQSHLFNGWYSNYSRPDTIYEGAPGDTKLVMKWNDAWLSNKSCDGDLLLDRHFGFDSPIGSGAWCTNHQSGSYEVDGKTYRWNYFVKIVAAPADAYKDGGYWYTANGVEIGPVIWGSYATVQQVYNDQGTGEHGIYYKSPAGPGLGKY